MPKKLIIDDTEIEVEDGITLLQACEEAGAEIPRFCYHERLSIAGNCRMCLVEVEGAPKPVASCAQTVNELRPNPDGTPNVIRTKSPLVKKAREGVMEFLLINHPLDCPICDQGGECDLQDQAMAFGMGGSRYTENKRAVENKYVGPLIKTIMTRCIHCTRCVRYMTEIAGVEELGLVGRGEDAEITTYLEHGLMSEMSANAVDLCPVGALTHRPWAHQARPWELHNTESIDVMDALGSNIRVDSRGREVMRILPRNNDAVNEEWISDKTRHIADGLRTQRLDQPYVRKDGRLTPASWEAALRVVAERIKAADPARIGAIAGDLAGVEEMYALKSLMSRLGSPNLDCRATGEDALDPSIGRSGYIFNATVESLDHADAVLIIGANPRLDCAVLNSRIRKNWRQTGLPVGLVGEPADLTYPATHLGGGSDTLADIASGSHSFAETLKSAKRPVIIVGMAAVQAGAPVLAQAAAIARAASDGCDEGWQPFNVLHTAAARVGGLDIGFVPGSGGMTTAGMLDASSNGGLDVLYLLGADELPLERVSEETFVVYQGSHGDTGAHRADVIFPAAAFTEKSVTYVNTEGRVQMTERAVFPPGEAKEDWAILRALSPLVGQTLGFDSLDELRTDLYREVPGLQEIDAIPETTDDAVLRLADAAASAGPVAFGTTVTDFYMTNPIARASAIMAELSAMKANAGSGAAATAAE